MLYDIFFFAKNFYDKWNIHIFVLLSLLLQTILILFAPFRKRTGRSMVIFLLWIAYLLADWAANFAVGLISNSQKGQKGANPKGFQQSHEHADILAFWAPFLLLHLGGPDTITAFALEDNALWLRHFVGLITQLVAAIIVFYQSFPNNKLWLPTFLMFLAGTIKYGERTRALYLANLDKFRKSMLKEPDPGPNYAKLMAEYSSKKEAKLPAQIELIAEPNRESKTARGVVRGNLDDDLEIVKYANYFFNIFRGLIVDLIFSFRERDESRIFFHERSPEDAFSVLATELNFMYEVLYTKVRVVHSMFGSIVRFVSWCVVVAALSKFYSLDKIHFNKIDIGTTYSLLFGAICLDTIALCMLAFSDWTVVAIKNSRDNIWMAPIKKYFLPLLKNFLFLKKIKWPHEPTGSWEGVRGWATQIFFGRWSGKVRTHNLISTCIKELPKQNIARRVSNFFIHNLGLKDMCDRITYVGSKHLEKNQWDFIFGELKKKSDLADDPETAKKICSTRGNFAIEGSISNDDMKKKLMHYVVDVDYDQSLMIWHIATELCYQTEDSKDKVDLEFCKMLSDYMLYLLVMQPTMMSVVAGIGEIRFRDTCAEAKRFFNEFDLSSLKEKEEEKMKVACRKILDINTDVKPVDLKGDRSKSVLFDACILAKKLKDLKEERWKVIKKVWVELLSYAASHCRASAHAALLSQGGELITFVWLLMAHFGIGEQFQINEGHARAKVIVGK